MLTPPLRYRRHCRPAAALALITQLPHRRCRCTVPATAASPPPLRCRTNATIKLCFDGSIEKNKGGFYFINMLSLFSKAAAGNYNYELILDKVIIQFN
jgi:hypothetical protein